MPPKISRFDIHDELTAPPESAPILKGALSGSGKLNNFVGVLAGSPAALRGYARMRSELRRGTLPAATQERIALAVGEYRGSEYDVAVHARAARNLGLSLDEIDLARQFASREEKEQALLRYLEVLLENRGREPAGLPGHRPSPLVAVSPAVGSRAHASRLAGYAPSRDQLKDGRSGGRTLPPLIHFVN